MGSSNPFRFTPAEGRFFFTAFDGSQLGVWVSDGTSAGTRQVKALPSFCVGLFTALGDGLFFAYDSDSDSYAEPWYSDGTTAGTVRLAPVRITLGCEV